MENRPSHEGEIMTTEVALRLYIMELENEFMEYRGKGKRAAWLADVILRLRAIAFPAQDES